MANTLYSRDTPVLPTGSPAHPTPVPVIIQGGGGAGGTSSTDKAAFTPGVSAGTPAMGVVNPVDAPGTGNLAVVALDANRNLKVNVVAGGAGGGAVTVADGADVTQGAIADAAVVTDANGSLSAKLRGLIVILLRAFALGTPLRIDPTGSTAQPVTGTVSATVSGTVTTTPPSNASTNVAQLAGTATSVNSGTKDAGTLRVVIATDQPQLTNKLLVTPDSVALPANQSVNAAQVGGTNTDTNSGNKSAGTLRVVIATDQPQLTNKLLVTPDSVALPANQSVNVSQIAATTTSVDAGISNAGTQRIVQASAPVLNVTQVSVLVTSTTVIAANTKRIKVRIINTSTNPVYIGPTNPATTGNGAYIPGIAGYPWTTRYEGALYAIATGGTALVTVDEEQTT